MFSHSRLFQSTSLLIALLGADELAAAHGELSPLLWRGQQSPGVCSKTALETGLHVQLLNIGSTAAETGLVPGASAGWDAVVTQHCLPPGE